MTTDFQKYITTRFRKLTYSLNEFERKADESHLHEIRIELKKIVTILIFYRFLNDNKQINHALHRMKFIFHKAGKIRENQLLEIWLTENKINSLLRLHFNKSGLSKKANNFQKKTNDFKQIIRKTKNLVKRNGKKITENIIHNYIQDMLTHIRHLISPIPTTDQWHALRKESKKLIFAISWLPNMINEPSWMQVYTNLQSEIGTWHDKMIILKALPLKHEYHLHPKKIQMAISKASSKLHRSIRYRENKIDLLLLQASKISKKISLPIYQPNSILKKLPPSYI